ncbi:hypothetical protein LT493_11615 [Streptomyces tricolor]|nr:hypothetical protein [Streptomyces tricolor]
MFLRHYEPDVLLVNHLPKGAENELAPALTSTRGGGGRRILTLRGVLFDADKTNRDTSARRAPAGSISISTPSMSTPTLTSSVSKTTTPYRATSRTVSAPPDTWSTVPAEQGSRAGAARRRSWGATGRGRHGRWTKGAMPLWNALIDALTKQDTEFDRVGLVTSPTPGGGRRRGAARTCRVASVAGDHLL